MAAVIACDQKLLDGIATILPQSPVTALEYEDNFHLSWLFILLAKNGCQLDSQVEYRLQSFQNSCKDQSKVELFKALLLQDDLKEEVFWTAIKSGINVYDEFVQEKLYHSRLILVNLLHIAIYGWKV